MFSDLKPAFEDNNIAIAFAIKDSWAKYLGVAIRSLIDNSSRKNNYDIIILSTDIQDYNKDLLLKYNSSNISVRIVNIATYLQNHNMKDFFTHHYWGIEMYYRVFLPDIMCNYDKVLYLDADIILQKDVANLYNIDIGNTEIGVCRTIRQVMHYHTMKEVKYYFDNVLKLNDINDYFNSGVLLMNLNLMRKNSMISNFIYTMKEINYLLMPDQDVFNVLYNNKKKFFIDISWNHIYYSDAELINKKQYILPNVFEEYIEAKEKPSLIHFAGDLKPWFEPDYIYSFIYWNYARRTDFYEAILITTMKRLSDKAIKGANYNLLKSKVFKNKIKSIFSFNKDSRAKFTNYKRVAKYEMNVLRAEFPSIVELFINKYKENKIFSCHKTDSINPHIVINVLGLKLKLRAKKY